MHAAASHTAGTHSHAASAAEFTKLVYQREHHILFENIGLHILYIVLGGRPVYASGVFENIIDLFTERYTKSEVTGQEYDTSVKDKAEPIEKEIMLTIGA